MPHKFTKPERLKSRKLIQQLFAGEGKAFVVYPIKVVWMQIAPTEPNLQSDSLVQFGVSVPVRVFAKATDRNLLKRRIKEAYRLQKQMLYGALQQQNNDGPPVRLAFMFIYLGKKASPYSLIYEKTTLCLQRLANML